MWLAGSSNWIGARAYPGRAITPLGWIKKPNACPWKRSRKPKDRKPLRGNWNGYGWHLKPATPNPRPVCIITKNWLPKKPGTGKKGWSYLFHPDPDWAMW